MSSYIFSDFSNTTDMKSIRDYIIENKNNFSYGNLSEKNIENYYKFVYICSALKINDTRYESEIITRLSSLKASDVRSKYYKILILEIYLHDHNYKTYNVSSLYNLPFSNEKNKMIISDVCSYNENNEEINDSMDKFYYLFERVYCNQFNKKDYNIFYDFISIREYNLAFLKNQINLYGYITSKYKF